MTRNETVDILSKIKSAYQNAFNTFDDDAKRKVLDLWHLHYENVGFEIVRDAVDLFISNDTKGFAPNIGQVNIHINEIVDKVACEMFKGVLLVTSKDLTIEQKRKMIPSEILSVLKAIGIDDKSLETRKIIMYEEEFKKAYAKGMSPVSRFQRDMLALECNESAYILQRQMALIGG